MKTDRTRAGMVVLRYVIGLVVLLQSMIFLFNDRAVESFAHTGLPDGIRLILGWSEVIASLLFLIPSTIVAGTWALLAVFSAAAVLHIAHGEFNIGSLLVYGVAAVVVMLDQKAAIGPAEITN